MLFSNSVDFAKLMSLLRLNYVEMLFSSDSVSTIKSIILLNMKYLQVTVEEKEIFGETRLNLHLEVLKSVSKLVFRNI